MYRILATTISKISSHLCVRKLLPKFSKLYFAKASLKKNFASLYKFTCRLPLLFMCYERSLYSLKNQYTNFTVVRLVLKVQSPILLLFIVLHELASLAGQPVHEFHCCSSCLKILNLDFFIPRLPRAPAGSRGLPPDPAGSRRLPWAPAGSRRLPWAPAVSRGIP